jgi:hypothetical protein
VAKTKEQRAAAERDRYRRNRDGKLAKQKAWDQANPEARRAARLKRRFGVTTAWYNEQLVAQNGGCAICGQPCQTGRVLAVDHNHATGAVRGLLCANHNLLLGKASDSIEVLERCIAYLRQHQD